MGEAKKQNQTLPMENVGLFIAAKAPRSGLLPATVRPPAFSERPREQTSHLLLLHTTQLQAGNVFIIQSCLTLCNSMDGILCPWNSPGKNTGVGCHSLLQGVFLTQGSNSGFPHCRQILYCLSHQRSPGVFDLSVNSKFYQNLNHAIP